MPVSSYLNKDKDNKIKKFHIIRRVTRCTDE